MTSPVYTAQPRFTLSGESRFWGAMHSCACPQPKPPSSCTRKRKTSWRPARRGLMGARCRTWKLVKTMRFSARRVTHPSCAPGQPGYAEIETGRHQRLQDQVRADAHQLYATVTAALRAYGRRSKKLDDSPFCVSKRPTTNKFLPIWPMPGCRRMTSAPETPSPLSTSTAFPKSTRRAGPPAGATACCSRWPGG